MTKKFEFNWQIPVPEPLLVGAVFDRWTEEKDNIELELACTFKVDEYGFFIYWKSEGRVSINHFTFYDASSLLASNGDGNRRIGNFAFGARNFRVYCLLLFGNLLTRDSMWKRTKNEQHIYSNCAVYWSLSLSHSSSSSYLFIFTLFTIFRALDGFFPHLFC